MEFELLLVVSLWQLVSPDCGDPDNNCVWQEWAPWSSCSVTCGGGSRTRVRPLCCPPYSRSFFACMEECGIDYHVIMDGSREMDHFCNIFCVNGGNYSYGKCRCPGGFYGRCCSYAYVNKVAIPEVSGDKLTAKEETNVTIKCQTSISRPTPLINWFLDNGTSDEIDDVMVNGHVFQTPEYGSDVLNVVTGVLTLNVNRAMNGWRIYCQADYVSSEKVMLDIKFPGPLSVPAMIADFREVKHNETMNLVEVNESEQVVFTCLADSNPASTLVIMKGSDELSHLSNALKITYTIEEISCLDAGVYTCLAKNDNNWDNGPAKENMELIVNCKPRLSPIDQTRLLYNASLNEKVVFTVPIMAYPVPQYSEWVKHNNTNWDELRQGIYQEMRSISNLMTEYTLTIPALQASDFGSYMLCVANELNDTCILVSIEDTGNLYPESKSSFLPSPPINVNIETERLDEHTTILKWSPGLDGGTVLRFVVMYRPVYGNKTFWKEVVVNTTHKVNEFKTSLTELDEGTRYTVRIFAENEFGNSTIEEISFETPDKYEVPTTRNDSLIPIDLIARIAGFLLLTSSIVVLIVFITLNIRQRLRTRTFVIQQPTCTVKSRKETMLFNRFEEEAPELI